MKIATLLKRAPTLIMVAFLAYACYSIHESMAGPAAAGTDLANGLDVMLKDVLRASADEMQGLSKTMIRDPFQVVLEAANAPKLQVAESPDNAEDDSLAGIVGSLTLDATFIQGKTQIAFINGRMYHQGQHLLVQSETGKSYSPLFVKNVQAQIVTLGARAKTYELRYPDQLGSRPAVETGRGLGSVDGSMAEIDPEGELAFYKRLANSPLGKMGKSLTGNMGVGAPSNRAGKSKAGRFRGARGSAAGTAP